MPNILPDAEARATITASLDRNLVVEAAAGTGKTTCLVARLCELVKTGALSGGSRIAAVTFTLKAANELKQRLQAEMERQAKDSGVEPEQRKRLVDGLAVLPECHIGTIHSFCARLLRERPVEAGVSPDFEELDQERDALFRLRAWNEFTRRLAAGEHRNLTHVFRTFGLDMDTLGDGFLRFAEYPDVEKWAGGESKMADIDLKAFIAGLREFADSLGGFGALLEKANPETDPLIPILQMVNRRSRRKFPVTVDEAFRLCSLFKAKPKPVKKHWKINFSYDGEQVQERYDLYLRFYENTVRPFLSQCHAAVYGAALAAYRMARNMYDRLRLESGVLNFQDLLMTTAAVLREYPDVRRELAARFDRILVDEVQDTDPIQAEILFLLASRDEVEKNWRLTVPRPGSLFIVGDPKQSIYRFRRADIVVYQELKEMIVRQGGALLELTANFRSQPAILDWVNKTFASSGDDGADPESVAASGRFAMADSAYSPAYVPLTAGKKDAAGNCLTGVYCLETLAAKRSPGAVVGAADGIRDEAARIAAFIRDALDRKALVPGREGARAATPGDFMVVTYQKASAPVYAAALGRLGIECEVSAGGALADSPALAMLRSYLAVLSNPDDPVAVLAVLRGPLYGVSDRELYRWKKAGGQFLFPYLPDSGKTDGQEMPTQALKRMREHHRLFRHADPVESLERIIDDLGLWAYACLGDDPDKQAGALFTAVELLKAERAGMPGPGGLLERLDWLRENYDGDILPPRPAAGDAVRVMNVHKTKGLEAPVVFLTGTRNIRSRPASFTVNRDGGVVAGGLLLAKGEYGNVPLACPKDWEAMAGREELFLQAERTRLNYVAATRAGSMLVVSVHPTSGVYKSAFLPGGDAGPVLAEKLPEPSVTPTRIEDESRQAIDAGELEAGGKERRENVQRITAATYLLERAKADEFEPGRFGMPGDAEREDADPDLAADIGEIVHRLLEMEYDADRLIDEARTMLAERERPSVMAGELADLVTSVRASDIWRRASAAEKCFREVPFTVADADGERPVVQRGVIDLVFSEGDGWVIVDYKSDRIPKGADVREVAKRHAAQLRAYARAWEKATDGTVADAMVFFVRTGECVGIL